MLTELAELLSPFRLNDETTMYQTLPHRTSDDEPNKGDPGKGDDEPTKPDQPDQPDQGDEDRPKL